MVQDLETQWIQSYPCKTKTAQETKKSLQKFLEPTRKPKVIYTDNSPKICKSCGILSWNHCTSTPHRSETNWNAEIVVRRIIKGTFAVLLQSGLDESWWADSMECYTYLRNVTDLLSDGKTPYERRFGKPFEGPVIPFGSLVEYHPITAKDQSRIHQFGKKVLPGLFLGYALYARGIWKGDVLIADLEELETMDASVGKFNGFHGTLCYHLRNIQDLSCLEGGVAPTVIRWNPRIGSGQVSQHVDAWQQVRSIGHRDGCSELSPCVWVVWV